MKKIFTVLIVLMLALGCVFAACDKPVVSDNTEHYDDITKTLKFNIAYSGKSFFTDGVTQATVAKYTDGDTTLFNLVGDATTANIRYYGVDTPESTGKVEKWGKAASNFTKERLSMATEIVLEGYSSTGASTPDKDSNGSRYLSYVWYKTETDDFKCLNLELVENGYSLNKVGASNARYDVFTQAENFARSVKLRWFSELDDPLYSDEMIPFVIKDFLADPTSYDTSGSTKVFFNAYLTSLTVSSSGTHTFVAAQYDEETGKEYHINVYAAYSSSAASSMKVGHYYYIVGRLQEYNGTYQISDINYIRSDKFVSDSVTYVEQKNYYLTFADGMQYIQQYSENFYGRVTVSEVGTPAADGTLTFKGSARKLTKDGYSSDLYEFTFTVNVDGIDYASKIYTGAVLKLAGLQYIVDSNQITIVDYNAID